jgi:hypothetical protein
METQSPYSICRPFKEPRNRFPAWRVGTTTLFVVQACQAAWAGGIGSSESIPGLHKRLQIRAQDTLSLYCTTLLGNINISAVQSMHAVYVVQGPQYG